MEKWSQVKAELASVERKCSYLKLALEETERIRLGLVKDEFLAYQAIPECDRPPSFADLPDTVLAQISRLMCTDVIARTSMNAVCKPWNRSLEKHMQYYSDERLRHARKQMSGHTLFIETFLGLGPGYASFQFDMTSKNVNFENSAMTTATATSLVSEDAVFTITGTSVEWSRVGSSGAKCAFTYDQLRLFRNDAGRRAIRAKHRVSYTDPKCSDTDCNELLKSRAFGIATMIVTRTEFMVVDARDGEFRAAVIHDGIDQVVHVSSALLLLAKYAEETLYVYSLAGVCVATFPKNGTHQFMFDLPDGSLVFVHKVTSTLLTVSPDGTIRSRPVDALRCMNTIYTINNVSNIRVSHARRYFACVSLDPSARPTTKYLKHECNTCQCVCPGIIRSDDSLKPHKITVYRTADLFPVAVYPVDEKKYGVSIDDDGRVFVCIDEPWGVNKPHLKIYTFPPIE